MGEKRIWHWGQLPIVNLTLRALTLLFLGNIPAVGADVLKYNERLDNKVVSWPTGTYLYAKLENATLDDVVCLSLLIMSP